MTAKSSGDGEKRSNIKVLSPNNTRFISESGHIDIGILPLGRKEEFGLDKPQLRFFPLELSVLLFAL